MLCFPEVFQQIMIGIVALSMYHNVYATNWKMSVYSIYIVYNIQHCISPRLHGVEFSREEGAPF